MLEGFRDCREGFYEVGEFVSLKKRVCFVFGDGGTFSEGGTQRGTPRQTFCEERWRGGRG